MSLSSATRISVSGLKASEAQIALSAANIANASTPGYSRKTQSTTPLTSPDGRPLGVVTTDASRTLDSHLLERHRESVSVSSEHDVVANYTSRLDLLFGQPGGQGALDTTLNEFTNSIAALSTNPSDYTTRERVLNDASILTSSLNGISQEVQDMRKEADQSISATVTRINQILQELETVNSQVAGAQGSDQLVNFLDQQDFLVSELSSLMEVDVRPGEQGRIVVATKSGMTLLERRAATLTFNETGTITAANRYSGDGSAGDLSGVGVTSGSGFTLNLTAQGSNIGGALGGYISVRDDILVQAQTQLDELAHNLAKTLSTNTVSGTDTFDTLTIDEAQNVSGVTPAVVTFSATELAALSDGDTITITDPNVNGGAAQIFEFDPDADGSDGATFSDATSFIAALTAAGGGAIAAAANANGDVEITTAAATSTFTVAFSDTASGQNESFELNLDGIQQGDEIALDFVSGTTTHAITFVRVDDPALIGANGQLNNAVTGRANDTVYGIPFDASDADAAAAMEAALNHYASANSLDPNDLTVGVSGTGDFSFAVQNGLQISEISAGITLTSVVNSGSLGMPFFVDAAAGGDVYSGSLDTDQQVGFAGRIGVNSALLADNSLLIVYETGANQTQIGDTTRADDLLNRLRDTDSSYRSDTGIGSQIAPFTGTVSDFMSQIISFQGSQSANAENLRLSSETTTFNYTQRIQAESAVNIDEEIALLTELQTAYEANARILSVVQELFDVLINI